mgnify:CR=1 FL=1
MKNQLKTFFLLGVLSALLVALGGTMGPGALYASLGIALLMNLGAYFFSDKIVLRMHHAREVDPREQPWLHETVAELAQKAQIPMPKVYIIPEMHANAFATGRNPAHAAVAVTEGILRVLDRRELRGVLAHELAHVKNRDILVASIAAMLAAAITYIAHMFSSLLFFTGGGGQREDEGGGGNLVAGILMMVLAPIAATLVQLGISRSREYLADETGARLSGDPEALASALRKLESAAQVVPGSSDPATASLFIVSPLLSGETLMNLFSTHPSTQQRVERLRALRLGA